MIYKIRSGTAVNMHMPLQLDVRGVSPLTERRLPTCVVLMNSHFTEEDSVRCIRAFILVLSGSVLFFALEQLLFVLSKLR